MCRLLPLVLFAGAAICSSCLYNRRYGVESNAEKADLILPIPIQPGNPCGPDELVLGRYYFEVCGSVIRRSGPQLTPLGDVEITLIESESGTILAYTFSNVAGTYTLILPEAVRHAFAKIKRTKS